MRARGSDGYGDKARRIEVMRLILYTRVTIEF
jgi:hypothetical protein